MNNDEDKLRSLSLTKPGADLDARMDRLFEAAAHRAVARRTVGLGHLFAASVLSAAAGIAVTLLVVRGTTPDSGEIVYVEKTSPQYEPPVFPVRRNPYDLSEIPIPALLDAPLDTTVSGSPGHPLSHDRQGRSNG